MKINNSLQNNSSPVSLIKEDVINNKNKLVIVREYNKNTKKLLKSYEGVISEVYSNFFVVFIKKANITYRKSIRYSDVSIGMIEYEIKEDV